jgi:hypothetical protein
VPEEVLKDANHLFMTKTKGITVYQMDGALQLASGRVIHLDVRGLPVPPAEKHRYVFFLKYDLRGSWFSIFKPWEIRDGAAVPMDPFDEALPKISLNRGRKSPRKQNYPLRRDER